MRARLEKARHPFAQSAVQRFVASISQESLPCTSLHALRHHRLRRCAARLAALTGWALQAGMPRSAVGLWLLYGGLVKLATSAVRASARGLLSSGPQIAHKSVSLPSAGEQGRLKPRRRLGLGFGLGVVAPPSPPFVAATQAILSLEDTLGRLAVYFWL